MKKSCNILTLLMTLVLSNTYSQTNESTQNIYKNIGWSSVVLNAYLTNNLEAAYYDLRELQDSTYKWLIILLQTHPTKERPLQVNQIKIVIDSLEDYSLLAIDCKVAKNQIPCFMFFEDVFKPVDNTKKEVETVLVRENFTVWSPISEIVKNDKSKRGPVDFRQVGVTCFLNGDPNYSILSIRKSEQTNDFSLSSKQRDLDLFLLYMVPSSLNKPFLQVEEGVIIPLHIKN